jgi:O-antigen/teichoic acid export membrane protein
VTASNSGNAAISVRKNIIANYVGAGWSALMGMVFVPTYIRYLGIEAYGLVGILSMLQGWLSLLDMGMAPALSREMALLDRGEKDAGRSIRNLLRTIEIIACCTAATAVLVMILASKWIASRWLQTGKLPVTVASQALVTMGVVIGLRFVENVYHSSMLGLQRQVLLNAITGTMSTVRGLGAVGIVVFVAPSIELFFLWQGAVSVITLSIFALVVYRVLPHSESPAAFALDELRRVRRYALGTLAIAVLSLLLMQVDKILLSRLLTLKAFGYYSFATTVAHAPFLVVGPVAHAFFPRFTKLYGQKSGELAASYHSAAQMIAVMLGSATLLLLAFGRELLEVWTKDPALTEQAYGLVSVLSVGSLLNGLLTIPYYLQLAAGWTGLTVRIGLVAIVLVIPALLVVVPAHGAVGAAWIWVALNSVNFFVAVHLMHRRLLPGEKWRWYLQDVLLPLSAAGITAALLRFVLPDGLGRLVTLSMLAGSGCVIFLAAAFAAPTLRPMIVSHLAALLRRCRSWTSPATRES